MENKIVLAEVWLKYKKSQNYVLVDIRKAVHRTVDNLWRSRSLPFVATHIEPEEHEVGDIYEFADLVKPITSGENKNRTLIYGQMSDYAHELLQKNKLINRSSTTHYGSEGTFSDVPQNLHCIDIDDIVLPPGYKTSENLQRLGLWLRDTVLPEEFHNKTIFVTATGSHGCVHKKGSRRVPRLRAFFWLKEPMTIAEFKHYAENRLVPSVSSRSKFLGKRPVDTSIYSEGHYIFLSPPRIESEGNPYKHARQEIVEGYSDEISIPQYDDLIELHPDDELSALAISATKKNQLRYSGTNDDLIARIAEGSHEPVRALMARYGRLYGEGAELKEAIDEITPIIIQQIKLSSVDDRDFDRRYREEIAGGKLYRSAVAFVKKMEKSSRRAVTPKQAKIIEPTSLQQLRHDAQADLRKLIEKAILRPKKINALLKYSAGFGKTHMTLNALDENIIQKRRIHYYSPNHTLAAQTAADLKLIKPDLDGYIRHYKGRKHLCISDEHNKLCEQMEKLKLSAFQNVCTNICPKRDECPWVSQMKDDKPGFIVMTHADIFTSLSRIGPGSKKMPALNIIDEDLIVSSAQTSAMEVSLKNLKPESCIYNIEKNGRILHGITADWASARSHLISCLDTQQEHQKRSNFIQINCIKSLQLERRMLSTLKNKAKKHATGQISALKNISKNIQTCYSAIGIYQAVLHSLANTDRDVIFGLRVTDNIVRIMLRPKLPDILKHPSMLYLDATCDEGIWRDTFESDEKEMVVHEVQPPTGAYKLTQCLHKNFSYSSLKRRESSGQNSNSKIGQLKRFIFNLAYEKQKRNLLHGTTDENGIRKDVLIICQKKIEESFDPVPSNVATAHFNALKGLNLYRNIPVTIIIGRPMPPIEMIEELTEALYYDKAVDKIEYINGYHSRKTVLTHRNKSGIIGGWEVDTQGHPTPLCNKIIKLIVDAEVEQAIGRARILNRTETNPAEIYVFGQLNTGYHIDREIRFEQSDIPLKKIIKSRGIIPTCLPSFKEFYSELLPRSDSGAYKVVAPILKQIEFDEGKLRRFDFKSEDSRKARHVFYNSNWSVAKLMSLLKVNAT